MKKILDFLIDYYFVISTIMFFIFYSILLYINKEEFKKKKYSIFAPILSSAIFSYGLMLNVGVFIWIFVEYIFQG